MGARAQALAPGAAHLSRRRGRKAGAAPGQEGGGSPRGRTAGAGRRGQRQGLGPCNSTGAARRSPCLQQPAEGAPCPALALRQVPAAELGPMQGARLQVRSPEQPGARALSHAPLPQPAGQTPRAHPAACPQSSAHPYIQPAKGHAKAPGRQSLNGDCQAPRRAPWGLGCSSPCHPQSHPPQPCKNIPPHSQPTNRAGTGRSDRGPGAPARSCDPGAGQGLSPSPAEPWVRSGPHGQQGLDHQRVRSQGRALRHSPAQPACPGQQGPARPQAPSPGWQGPAAPEHPAGADRVGSSQTPGHAALWH